MEPTTRSVRTAADGSPRARARRGRPAAWLLLALLWTQVAWTARAEESVFRYGVTPHQLQTEFFGDRAADGYRPARLTGYPAGNSTRDFTR